ncbi:MAG: S1C family serine protease [Pseudonocardia sp.]
MANDTPDPDGAAGTAEGENPAVPGHQYSGSQYPRSVSYGTGPGPYGGIPYSGAQYGSSPYPGPYPDSHHTGGQPGRYEPRMRRRVLAGVVPIVLATTLLGGGVGGAVGYSLANRGGTSSGVLDEPLPEIAQATAPQGPVEAVAERVLPSVVQLRVEGPTALGEGSGMVLSADGLLLTNNHVVEPAADRGRVTVVFQDGATAPAQIVGRDPSSDLAVIRAQNVSGLAPVELGNSEAVRVGQQVVAFGSPLGLGGTVTTGIISAVDRPVSVGGEQGASEATVLNALQTDAAINPGNSGGPLVDMQGRVVGINSAIATTGTQGGSIGVGFSIPVNQAKRVAEELVRTGKAARAILGVNVTSDPQLSGARISSVVPGSAAEAAGIRAGDLVIRFGDQLILAGDGLQAAVRSRAPGEVVEVELADRTVLVTLGEAP